MPRPELGNAFESSGERDLVVKDEERLRMLATLSALNHTACMQPAAACDIDANPLSLVFADAGRPRCAAVRTKDGI